MLAAFEIDVPFTVDYDVRYEDKETNVPFEIEIHHITIFGKNVPLPPGELRQHIIETLTIQHQHDKSRR